MAEIKLHEGESIESALRRFKRRVQTEDIIKEVKKHSYYLKPGEKSVSNRRWRESGAARRSIGGLWKIGNNKEGGEVFGSDSMTGRVPSWMKACLLSWFMTAYAEAISSIRTQ